MYRKGIQTPEMEIGQIRHGRKHKIGNINIPGRGRERK